MICVESSENDKNHTPAYIQAYEAYLNKTNELFETVEQRVFDELVKDFDDMIEFNYENEEKKININKKMIFSVL